MITVPTLVLDEQKCKANIAYMAEKARQHRLIFRPHFKTHQSLEIGRWFKEAGVTRITVSSLTMAEYFSAEWKDITVAFPVNLREMDTINRLADQIQLNLLAESVETVRFLNQHLKGKIDVYIKLDVGTRRTGIEPENTALIDAILHEISRGELIKFSGFISHAGHTYGARGREAVLEIHEEVLRRFKTLNTHYRTNYPDLIMSYGDTPSSSIADQFEGVDELRPGNFVFYDCTQAEIGSNAFGQIAVAVACPIVALHSERKELVVYGGGIHFSKDRMESDGSLIFGRVAENAGHGWGAPVEGMVVRSLSQEHGIVSCPDHFDRYKVGDLLYILPVHSCMTADLFKSYLTTNGKRIRCMHSYV